MTIVTCESSEIDIDDVNCTRTDNDSVIDVGEES